MPSSPSMRRSWCALGIGSVLLGCAGQQRIDQLEDRLAAAEAKLETQDATPPGASAEELAALEQRMDRIESWSSQSQDHAIALAKTVEELSKELEGVRRRTGDVGPGTFEKGQKIPPGSSALELRQYAIAQGDPHMGRFTLAEALAGDPTLSDRSKGALVARFETSRGRFDCVLHEEQAPLTVANFVGLARGVRASLDSETDTWLHRRLYDDTVFHRVIAKFMIQGGDPEGVGRGGPGYAIEDEIDPSLEHRVGVLSMANRGANTGGSQFFITVAKTPHLDGRHVVFGQCKPKVPIAISKVPTGKNNVPDTPVVLERITITRKRR